MKFAEFLRLETYPMRKKYQLEADLMSLTGGYHLNANCVNQEDTITVDLAFIEALFPLRQQVEDFHSNKIYEDVNLIKKT